MSVLVWDGTTLAADSQANTNHMSFPFQKLWEIPGQERLLCGAIGHLQAIAELRLWSLNGRIPEQYPTSAVYSSTQLVTVSKEKGLIRYNNSGLPLLHGYNKIAIGEGAPFAYGALYMGATAEQAVAAAIQYCPHCSGEPVSLTL